MERKFFGEFAALPEIKTPGAVLPRAEISEKRALRGFFAFIRYLEVFVSSKEAMPVLALFVILCHLAGWDTAGFTVLTVYVAFVFCSGAFIRGSVPALLLSLFTISVQNGIARPGLPLDGSYYLARAPYFIFLIAVAVLTAVYGIWKRRLKIRFTPVLWSVAALSVSLLLGGAFKSGYAPLDIITGSIIAGYFLLIFLFFAYIVPTLSFDYIACAALTAAVCVLFELTALFLKNGLFLRQELDKSDIALGFGISNNIGILIASGMPFAAYYMRFEKPVFFFTVLLLLLGGVVLTLSRSAALLAVPFAVFAVGHALIRSKPKTRYKLAAALGVFVAAGLVFLMVFRAELRDFFNFYFASGFNDRGRAELYREALAVFKKYPLFGAGTAYRFNDTAFWDLIVFLVHNTFLQCMLWSGICGLIAIVFHAVAVIRTAVVRPNEKSFFLLASAGLIFMHSMLDWMWFFPFALIYYMMCVTAAEYDITKFGTSL